jgi:preprotein translocase subunit SecA
MFTSIAMTALEALLREGYSAALEKHQLFNTTFTINKTVLTFVVQSVFKDTDNLKHVDITIKSTASAELETFRFHVMARTTVTGMEVLDNPDRIRPISKRMVATRICALVEKMQSDMTWAGDAYPVSTYKRWTAA